MDGIENNTVLGSLSKSFARPSIARRITRKHPPTNPYIEKIANFPGRIFCFRDESAESLTIRSHVRAASSVICELGSGSGGHLIELALRNPKTLCLGFELRYKRAVRTIEKAELRGAENIFVLHTDARFVDKLLPPSSVDTLFINFPDPWPKRSQEKNRLLGASLLDSVATLLKPSGRLSVKTDSAPYFAQFSSILAARSDFQILRSTTDLAQSPFAAGPFAAESTEFERLFRSQGKAICWLECAKKENES